MAELENRNVYIGHRYVPKIFGEWSNENTYEGLSIVTYQGASYTSKKHVPVGIDILNEEFWVVTGNYNAQVEAYRQEVVAMNDNISTLETETNEKIKLYGITPEDFGAIGDGITDDTEALQAALNMSATTGVKLISGKDKKYKVSSNLYLTGHINVDFGNATILADVGVTQVLKLEVTGVRNDYGSQFSNIIIDGNNIANVGLNAYFGRKSIYENIQIKNTTEIGLIADNNHEVTFSAIHIENSPIGIHVVQTDMTFTHIFLRECHKGIVIDAGHNIYDDVHGWLVNLSAGSTLIEQNTGGIGTFSKIYVDNYQYGFKINNYVRSVYNNCRYFAGEYEGNTYLFYFEDREYSNVGINSCYTNGSRVANFYFMNIDKEQFRGVTDGGHLTESTDKNVPLGNKVFFTLLKPTVTTTLYGNVFRKNQRVVGNLVLKYTGALGKGYNTSLISIPESSLPPYKINFNASFGKLEGDGDNVLNAVIDETGVMQFKLFNNDLNETVNDGYVNINFSYDVK